MALENLCACGLSLPFLTEVRAEEWGSSAHLQEVVALPANISDTFQIQGEEKSGLVGMFAYSVGGVYWLCGML